MFTPLRRMVREPEGRVPILSVVGMLTSGTVADTILERRSQ